MSINPLEPEARPWLYRSETFRNYYWHRKTKKICFSDQKLLNFFLSLLWILPHFFHFQNYFKRGTICIKIIEIFKLELKHFFIVVLNFKWIRRLDFSLNFIFIHLLSPYEFICDLWCHICVTLPYGNARF